MPSPKSFSRRSTDGYDPLAHITAPPPNETAEERQLRLDAETEAQRISDAIDHELQLEEKTRKKAGEIVKILLLGRSQVVFLGQSVS